MICLGNNRYIETGLNSSSEDESWLHLHFLLTSLTIELDGQCQIHLRNFSVFWPFHIQ